jgi:hypothetical protein
MSATGAPSGLALTANWTQITSPFSHNGEVEALAYGGGLWVAGTSTGEFGEAPQIATSSDGITWTLQGAGGFGAGIGIWRITYGNSLFVAVSDEVNHTLKTSPDGVTWTARSAAFTGTINDLAYGNGVWVAVGSAGKLYTTTDPTSVAWTSRTSGFGATRIVAAIYGGTRWVAVGSSGATAKYSYSDNDGASWTNGSLPNGGVTDDIQDIAYGAGAYVAITSTGHYSSADGAAWTAHNLNASSGSAVVEGLCIAFGGEFVAVGFDNRSWHSADGTTFAELTTGSFWSAASTNRAVASDGSRFVAGSFDTVMAYIDLDGNLEYRSEVDGSLINRVFLSAAPDSMRRTPDGQHVFVKQGNDTLVRYNRRLELEDTVTITGFFPVQDWNADDQFNLFKIDGNVLYRYHANGSESWAVDLNAETGYHFPSLAASGGNGLQLYTGRSSGNGAVADGYVRVVGYIGGADWTTGSDACLLVVRRSDGTIEDERRWGGDSSDAAQAQAIVAHGNCLYIAGAADGATFEDITLSGQSGFLVRGPLGLTGSDGGVAGSGLSIGEDV